MTDQSEMWRVAFDERHEFDVYPDHFMTGMKNEFCAGWHAALKGSTPTVHSNAQLEDARHQGYLEGLRDANASIAAERETGAIPADVGAALARMCSPLHESRLSGVTAEEDARCMVLISGYILAGRPIEQLTPPTFDRDSTEAWMLRAQMSLEKGEPGAARIEIEKALQFLNVGPAKEPL